MSSTPATPAQERHQERYIQRQYPIDRYAGKVERSAVISAIQAVAATSRQTVVFVSPNNPTALTEGRYDFGAYKDLSNTLRLFCEATTARCFDFSLSLGGENFYDIIHFNTVGNRAFSRILTDATAQRP